MGYAQFICQMDCAFNFDIIVKIKLQVEYVY